MNIWTLFVLLKLFYLWQYCLWLTNFFFRMLPRFIPKIYTLGPRIAIRQPSSNRHILLINPLYLSLPTHIIPHLILRLIILLWTPLLNGKQLLHQLHIAWLYFSFLLYLLEPLRLLFVLFQDAHVDARGVVEMRLSVDDVVDALEELYVVFGFLGLLEEGEVHGFMGWERSFHRGLRIFYWLKVKIYNANNTTIIKSQSFDIRRFKVIQYPFIRRYFPHFLQTIKYCSKDKQQ